ncbi:hypothetical protein FA95DRAFT_1682779, partial [Auriscalpium vulgare]
MTVALSPTGTSFTTPACAPLRAFRHSRPTPPRAIWGLPRSNCRVLLGRTSARASSAPLARAHSAGCARADLIPPTRASGRQHQILRITHRPGDLRAPEPRQGQVLTLPPASVTHFARRPRQAWQRRHVSQKHRAWAPAASRLPCRGHTTPSRPRARAYTPRARICAHTSTPPRAAYLPAYVRPRVRRRAYCNPGTDIRHQRTCSLARRSATPSRAHIQCHRCDPTPRLRPPTLLYCLHHTSPAIIPPIHPSIHPSSPRPSSARASASRPERVAPASAPAPWAHVMHPRSKSRCADLAPPCRRPRARRRREICVAACSVRLRLGFVSLDARSYSYPQTGGRAGRRNVQADHFSSFAIDSRSGPCSSLSTSAHARTFSECSAYATRRTDAETIAAYMIASNTYNA